MFGLDRLHRIEAAMTKDDPIKAAQYSGLVDDFLMLARSELRTCRGSSDDLFYLRAGARAAYGHAGLRPADAEPVSAGADRADSGPGPALGRRAPARGAQENVAHQYAAQRAFVRKAPDDSEVASVIDALAQAGGKIPVASLARLAGQPAFRMGGYLAQLGRLLNVDGYPVIGVTDEGRTAELNVTLSGWPAERSGRDQAGSRGQRRSRPLRSARVPARPADRAARFRPLRAPGHDR